MSDPGTTYRSREEIQYMRTSNDPIRGIQKRCLESGIATEEEFKAIDVAVRKQIDAVGLNGFLDALNVILLLFSRYRNSRKLKPHRSRTWPSFSRTSTSRGKKFRKLEAATRKKSLISRSR
jgi:hypothetical protein